VNKREAGRRGFERLLILAAAVGIALAGCSKGEKQQAAGDQGGGDEVVKAVTGNPDDEIARVNDEVITLGEVDRIVTAWKSGQMPDINPNTPTGELQKQALDHLVSQTLLYQEAAKAGTVPSDEEVQAQVEQIQKSQNLDQAGFEENLKQRGITLPEFTHNVKVDYAIRRFLVENVQDTIQVTPEQAKTYYESNIEQFRQPEQVHARHILLRVDPNGPADADAAAKTRIEEIAHELKGGADFAALAKEKSDDRGSAVNGGDLGFFRRGQMVAPFDSVAFALAPGQTSDPIRTQFGYHIIRVEEKKPAGLLDYNEVEGRLIQVLRNQRVRDTVNSLIEDLKAKADIKRKV